MKLKFTMNAKIWPIFILFVFISAVLMSGCAVTNEFAENYTDFRHTIGAKPLPNNNIEPRAPWPW